MKFPKLLSAGRKGNPTFLLNILFLIPGEVFVPTALAPKPNTSTTCLSNYGVDYTGDLAVTVGGHTCLLWSSPEVRALSKHKEFSSGINLPGNKCRNPDEDPEGLWCYVKIRDNVTVDYCDIELCGKYDVVRVQPRCFGLGLGRITRLCLPPTQRNSSVRTCHQIREPSSAPPYPRRRSFLILAHLDKEKRVNHCPVLCSK